MLSMVFPHPPHRGAYFVGSPNLLSTLAVALPRAALGRSLGRGKPEDQAEIMQKRARTTYLQPLGRVVDSRNRL